MSPNTDAYWVGALAMAAARARHLILKGLPENAIKEIDDVFARFDESPVLDDGLRKELAPYWPKEEIEE